MLFISSQNSKKCAVPIKTVLWFSYILGEPGSVESLRSKSFPTIPSAPTTIGTTFVFILQHLDISIRRSWYLQIFSDVFEAILVSDGTEISSNVHFFFSSLTTMSGLFACILLNVYTELSHKTVCLFLSLIGFYVCTTYF